MLWVNGEPFSVGREGPPPPATANPVYIGSGMWKGANFVGSIEYVKIYAKVLPTTEIVKRAYGIGQESPEKISRQAEFDFADGLQGWQPREGAAARISNSRLLAKSPSARGFLLRSALQVPGGKKGLSRPPHGARSRQSRRVDLRDHRGRRTRAVSDPGRSQVAHLRVRALDLGGLGRQPAGLGPGPLRTARLHRR